MPARGVLASRVRETIAAPALHVAAAAGILVLIALFTFHVPPQQPRTAVLPDTAPPAPPPQWQTATVSKRPDATVTVPSFFSGQSLVSSDPHPPQAVIPAHPTPPEEDRALMTAIRAFHAGTDKLRNDADYTESLAGLLGVARFTDAAGAKDALAKAKVKSRTMRTYAGHFPLPISTPVSLLALLTPEDVLFITDSLNAMVVQDSQLHTLSSSLSADGAVLTGQTQSYWQMGSNAGRCLTYDLTFTRAAYSASISSDACRTASGWTMKAPSKH